MPDCSSVLARPKSVRYTRSEASSMTFWGFKSRWMTPCSCAACSPSQIWRKRRRVRAIGQALLALDERREVLPLDVVHREVRIAIGLAEVVNAQDVLVRDLARELDLALEALDHGFVLGDVRADQLERDLAVELLILDLVDGPHASAPQNPKDPVAFPDLHPRGQHRSGGRRGPRLPAAQVLQAGWSGERGQSSRRRRRKRSRPDRRARRSTGGRSWLPEGSGCGTRGRSCGVASCVA